MGLDTSHSVATIWGSAEKVERGKQGAVGDGTWVRKEVAIWTEEKLQA